jgi:DNA-binding SARP family transcriptional activator
MLERRVDAPAGRAVPTTEWRLRLLQGFEFSLNGRPLALPLTAQRLMGFLAIAARPVNRLYAAGVLWPDSPESRASGSLRSALWRLHRTTPGAVLTVGTKLALSPSVLVDLHEMGDRAHRLLGGAETNVAGMSPYDFAHDLLPDWYDDWLAGERERLRQLQLHALDALSTRLAARADYAQAVEAALLAVSIEPTRESARRALIRAHLAEGNLDEAIRQFEHFRALLARELGVRPSRQLTELLSQGADGGSPV